jgi:molybdopterin-guanine dinucleotide biosynthesis protein A
MIEAEGFILIGGASRRMGKNKAELRLGELSFVEYVSKALTKLTSQISLVSSRSIDTEWTIPVIYDLYKDCGAMGGVHAALSACKAPWAAIVACDLPLVTSELFLNLSSYAEGFDSVVPVQPDGRLQPLCALYARTPCLEKVEDLIEKGELRIHKLLETIQTRSIRIEEMEGIDHKTVLLNINTPEDYTQARELIIKNEA